MRKERVRFSFLAALALVWPLTLSGCFSDMFRDKVKTEIIEIERYDPKSGKPLKSAEIIDQRPIRVRYRGPDGKTIIKEEKRTGGFVNPPPLPKEEKAEAEPSK